MLPHEYVYGSYLQEGSEVGQSSATSISKHRKFGKICEHSTYVDRRIERAWMCDSPGYVIPFKVSAMTIAYSQYFTVN